MSGRLRTVAYTPRTNLPTLEADLYDGSDVVTLVFLGRRSIVPSANSGMPLWQDKLFIFLMKNSANPTDFFKIPPGRVVELGAQVTV